MDIASNSEFPFLDRLTERDASALRAIGVRRRFPSGATLFFEGEPAHEVIVIEKGDVSILVTSTEGREIVVDVFSAGSLLGELSAIDGGSRSASATALVDVDVLTVPIARFAEYLDSHPQAQKALLLVLAGRLRGATRRHLEFGTVDALGRVCARLDELARRFGRMSDAGVVIESPVTQTDIGNWAGLSREAVVKALRSLRALGWIDSHRNTIVVRDLEALRARAMS
jgi:CRP-like cAMP-binding protein